MASPTGTSTSSAASANVTSTNMDLKAPLWSHVTILEKPNAGGGNTRWKCKYCQYVGFSSYTRVDAHLLQKSGKGIGKCPKVTHEIFNQMRGEVERCKDMLERSKKVVSLPTPSGSTVANKKRGPPSQLEKTWSMEDRHHMDALIARAFYSGGLAFNFARNPYIQEAFTFACSRNLTGYKMPGYNKLRTTLLKQERAHIKNLLKSTKGTWQEKGVTICADGWSDPQRRPLINFIAISEKAPMFLQANNCEGEVKTKEYIAQKLKAIIDEVGRQNVVQVITDNAANCKGAGLLIEAEYENIF